MIPEQVFSIANTVALLDWVMLIAGLHWKPRVERPPVYRRCALSRSGVPVWPAGRLLGRSLLLRF